MRGRYLLLGIVLGLVLSVLLVGAFVVYAQTRPIIVPQLPEESGVERLRVTVDETLLTDLVAEAARKQDPTMEKVVVDLRPGGWLDIVLGAKVTVAGQTATVQLRLIGALAISSGRLHLSISQMELAGVPISIDLLPAALRDEMDALLNDANELVAEALVETGFQVLSARTDESTLTVSLAPVSK
jgi:hypothetical protein